MGNNGKRNKPHRIKDNQKIDVMTGKRVGNKEIVLCENAIDYVKKIGYIVIPERNERMIKVLAVILPILAVVFVSGGWI